MVKQKHSRLPPDPPVLRIETNEGEKLITNQMHTRLLGLNLHQDMSWRSHLELGKKSLYPAIRKRLGALTHVGKSIPRKGRLVLANGLLMSKFIYAISVWGGTHQTNLVKWQRLQNKSARFVINGGKHWKTQRLVKNCNWLTIQ